MLHFSDAPDEEYLLWSSGGDGDYLVRDSNGVEIPLEQASWRLSPGALERQNPESTRDRLWLLHLKLERQPPRRDQSAGPLRS